MADNTLLHSFEVIVPNGTFTVNIHQRSLSEVPAFDFGGQKIFHPFPMISIDEECTFRDRKSDEMITIMRQGKVYDLSTDNDDIMQATEFQLKHDGACGYIMYKDGVWEPWTRFDIKKHKKGPKQGQWKREPEPHWIACSPKPTDPNATHWPHFRPCSDDPKGYKWQLDAFKKAKDKFEGTRSFTCEYMGTKSNGKASDPITHDCVIVPHGTIYVDVPVELRTAQGMKAMFKVFPVEGLIAHTPNKIYKIRREMFHDGTDRQDFMWPDPNETLALSIEAALI